MDRDASLALLRRHHSFPGPFEFRVVVRRPAAPATITAMVAAAGDEAVLVDVTERPSSAGRYLALHVRIEVPDAERVLDVYEILRVLDGVLTAL